MVCKIAFVLVLFLSATFALPTVPSEQVDKSNSSVQPIQINRIVGGTIAAEGRAPYVVALTTGWIFRNLICGGSLISEQYVLTAAHCVDAVYSFGFLRWSPRVTVGTNRWNRGGEMYSLSRNITHPEYNPAKLMNDIALLVTKSRVRLSPQVVPVALSFEFVGSGVVTRAYGWGRTKFLGPISDNLQQLTVNTIDGQQCVAAVAAAAAELGVRAPPVNPNVELCTLHSPSHGMCNGDSGSALVRLDSKQQIGVVSWGLPCARGAPDMFVRISAYEDWLLQNVNG